MCIWAYQYKVSSGSETKLQVYKWKFKEDHLAIKELDALNRITTFFHNIIDIVR